MWGLLGFVIVQSLLVSTLAYNTLPGVSRNAAMRLAMAGEDGGSATGKVNVMLRKKKVKEAEDLKAEMAAEGESNPINVSVLVLSLSRLQLRIVLHLILMSSLHF